MNLIEERPQRESIPALRVSDWRPWAWCNLRRNPFGELTRLERVEAAIVDVDGIARHATDARRAIQLMGDCGRGKTTRMLALAARYPDASYIYLAEGQPCGVIAEGRPTLIDEAQRLPRSVQKQVFVSGFPLVLATHRDLTRSLRRFGYRVHTIQIGDSVDAALVQRIMNRRIELSRLADGGVPVLSIEDAERLVSRFGSDIRSMEGFLYERVQTQTSNSSERKHGEMRFVD